MTTGGAFTVLQFNHQAAADCFRWANASKSALTRSFITETLLDACSSATNKPSTTVELRDRAKKGLGVFVLGRIRNSLFWIVLIAFLLRLGWILLGHTYNFESSDTNFGFGWEMGRIAASIASGHGFSNPFGPPTGPTAWEPPLYPYLTAEVFLLFGIYSKTSAFVMLTLNSVFSALTCIPIFLTARRIFSETIAAGSAWAWALLPNVMFWCTRSVWETSLSALLFSTIFWMTLAFEDKEGWLPWLEFGLLWGLAALNNTSLLSFLPVAGIWIWRRRAKVGKRCLIEFAMASMMFLACITPWLVRNYLTFGEFVFIRDNFGAELRLGNGPEADGTWMQQFHPSQNVYALREYESLGELTYVAARKKQAVEFIKKYPLRFAQLSAKRVTYFWAGPPRPTGSRRLSAIKNSIFLLSSVLTFTGLVCAFRIRKPEAWLLLALLLIYPAVYYVVFALPRYQVPIQPEMVILCVFALIHGWSQLRKATA